MRNGVIVFFMLLISVHSYGQKKKKSKLTIPNVEVIETPVIEWKNYESDTTRVGSNIQTLSTFIKSRVPLHQIEIKVNGLTTDVYNLSDFASAVGSSRYEQLIERTITLRTGSNTIVIIAENSRGVKVEGIRRVIVDPNQIAMLRDKKDQTPPMIYISGPSNIKNDRVLVFDALVKITGTVMDESGIQELIVNNTVTPVKTNGSFNIFLPLNVGETGITIEARDVNQNISLKKFVIERKNMDGSAYDPAEAKNFLLVVGIDAYTIWPHLNNAVRDAASVRDVLTQDYKFDSANVISLTNENATRFNIYATLRNYIEMITPRDNLLIYFSGHGYFDKLLSEGYWVPVEAATNDVSAFVPNSQVLKIIENINSQHTFLVADACFSGSLFAASTRGYTEHVEKYKSRWGLASGRLEFVSDGSGTNSPFAQSFIGFLRNNREPKVAVSDLVQYVKKTVTETNAQTPVGNPLKGVGDEGGEFIFYRRF